MKNIAIKFSPLLLVQIFIFLFVNGLFIFKYLGRLEVVNTTLVFCIYASLFLGFLIIYDRLFNKNKEEKIFRIGFWSILIIASLLILFSLNSIDRYEVAVDRWSAVTFFLDGLFRGEYPYGIHTHVWEYNYPSPFPVWYLINLPFYFLGDVGLGLIFFLWLTGLCLYYFFGSYKKAFLFLFLLCISPAYWWEIAVRSDSLSNGLLVLCFILWFSKKGYTLSSNFILATICCGLLASTRLSAILPIALYFFSSYIRLSWRRKIIFPIAIIGIVFIMFSPFIFWDTDSWVFFSRNPFMSQTSVGSSYVLLIMMALGCFLSLQWKNMKQFFDCTSVFIFIFMLGSFIGLFFNFGINGSFFTHSIYDISYFTLAFPFCLSSISEKMNSKLY